MASRAGHAEVGEVGPAVVVEEHVGRLDVAVHDAGAVGGGQGGEQVVGEPARPRRAAAGRGDLVGEGAAGEVRHDQHEVVAVVDDVEQRDDARVVEAAEHLGLAPDAGPGRGHVVGRAVQGEPLERHPVAVGAGGEVDDAHAAPSEPPLDHVRGPLMRAETVPAASLG